MANKKKKKRKIKEKIITQEILNACFQVITVKI